MNNLCLDAIIKYYPNSFIHVSAKFSATVLVGIISTFWLYKKKKNKFKKIGRPYILFLGVKICEKLVLLQ